MVGVMIPSSWSAVVESRVDRSVLQMRIGVTMMIKVTAMTRVATIMVMALS